MLTQTGVQEWCAPEILSGKYYNEKIDMWSTGCIIYFILIGQKPFDNCNVAKLNAKIAKGDFTKTD